MKTYVKKIFREIELYKERSLLTLIGIIIGISAFGAVLSAYSILDREMNKNFMNTNPASIVINVDNLDEKAINLIKDNYTNLEIEARKTVQGRISREDGTYGIMSLRAIADFSKLKVDTFTLEKGTFPAQPMQMALERDDLKLLKNITTGTDEDIVIKLPQGLENNVHLTGLVHSPGLAPASMENISYGFVSLDTLNKLGENGWFNELHIVAYENRFDQAAMKELSINIKQLLIDNGYLVKSVDVPQPGKHPHASQLSSLLFLLQAFAFIALLIACMIIVNLINFLMSQQTKQIAVMKVLGASYRNIAFPYFLYVLLISICSFFISIPLSIWAASGYSNFAAEILNFKITSYATPTYVFLLQLLISIVIPLASAAYPIYKSCTQSVKAGLAAESSELNTNKYIKFVLPKTNNKLIVFISSQFKKLIAPINNLNRKRKRTLLAVTALAAGGILFMTALNIVVSIDKTIELNNKTLSWDYQISLAENYSNENITNALKNINNLNSFELWKINSAFFKKADNTNSSSFPIKIIPRDTHMIKSIEASNSSASENTIIINNALAKEENWLKSGSTTEIELGNKTVAVTIGPIVNEIPPIPGAYIYEDTFYKLFGDMKSSQMLLATANTRDINEQRQITKQIESNFKASNIQIAENWNIYVLRKALSDHLQVIITFLSIIAILAVTVGGLSISSVIGINISERKREIGVMRTVGARNYQIISLITLEAVIIGLISWSLGVLASYPVSILVGNYFGNIFLDTNLQNIVDIRGTVEWLCLSISISALAGIIPAYRISKAPLKEMLAYE